MIGMCCFVMFDAEDFEGWYDQDVLAVWMMDLIGPLSLSVLGMFVWEEIGTYFVMEMLVVGEQDWSLIWRIVAEGCHGWGGG